MVECFASSRRCKMQGGKLRQGHLSPSERGHFTRGMRFRPRCKSFKRPLRVIARPRGILGSNCRIRNPERTLPWLFVDPNGFLRIRLAGLRRPKNYESISARLEAWHVEPLAPGSLPKARV